MNYNPQNSVLTAGGVGSSANMYANAYPNYQQQYINPTTKLTIEQQNYLNQQQQQYVSQNDPYTAGSTLLAQCSDLVRSRIMQDERYKKIDNECERLIKQYIYASVIPQILVSQDGRIAFEKWENCIKGLKQEYSQEEVQITQNMQVLLQDEVVKARLRELQNGNTGQISQQQLLQHQLQQQIMQQKAVIEQQNQVSVTSQKATDNIIEQKLVQQVQNPIEYIETPPIERLPDIEFEGVNE